MHVCIGGGGGGGGGQRKEVTIDERERVMQTRIIDFKLSRFTSQEIFLNVRPATDVQQLTSQSRSVGKGRPPYMGVYFQIVPTIKCLLSQLTPCVSMAAWQKLGAVTTHEQPLEIGISRIPVESMNTTHGEVENIDAVYVVE